MVPAKSKEKKKQKDPMNEIIEILEAYEEGTPKRTSMVDADE